MTGRHAAPPVLLNLTPHEPTDMCNTVHCYSHHIDEDGTGAYIVCGECGHVYMTKRELRRAYRREFWQNSDPARQPAPPSELLRTFGVDIGSVLAWKPSLAHRVWRVLTVRASRIYFCQECIHDF